MITVVGGGVRSGKSAFALRRARELGRRRVFVATAEASDAEMAARIDAHRAERGDGFTTIEAPGDLDDAIRSIGRADVVVIDCLTMFVSRCVLRGDDDRTIGAHVDRLVQRLESASFHSIVVTNEVGFGVVPPSSLGRRFRDAAGRAHQVLVAAADEVYLGVLGLVVRLVPAPVAVMGAAR